MIRIEKERPLRMRQPSKKEQHQTYVDENKGFHANFKAKHKNKK